VFFSANLLHFAETFASFMGSSGLASRRTGKEEKEMLAADFVIGIGQIVPHMVAGFAGGAR